MIWILIAWVCLGFLVALIFGKFCRVGGVSDAD